MLLDEVTGGLDALLERKRIADWSNNGLQIEGCDQIRKIAFAVDAGLKTIQLAVEAKADLLVVHHGLFWNQPLMITGTHRQRVAACIESNLSLYAAHLPLDVHPLYGNNAGILEDAVSPSREILLKNVVPRSEASGSLRRAEVSRAS